MIKIGFLWGLLVWAGCSGTETGNPDTPLSHFQGSACKTEQTPTTGPVSGGGGADSTGQSQDRLVAAEDYNGFECVEWERASDASSALTVRLLNFRGGCDITWNGRAVRRDDGSLDLLMVNAQCAVARCGSCLYDATFDLSASLPSSAGAGLTVHVGTQNCASNPEVQWAYDIALPLSTAPSGIKCRYAGLNSVLTDKACSGKNLLCGGHCGTCPGSLQCTEIADQDSRCLQTCSVDTDCVPRGTTTCQGGVCKLAEPF